MAIKDWPLAERPREKLLYQGAAYLSDAELLAIFIRNGTEHQTAIDIARQMLNEHGNLRCLLNLSASEFCKYEGIGKVKYAQLQAALEIGRRYLKRKLEKGSVVNSPQTSREYLQFQLRDKPYEVFYAMFLDNKNRILVSKELFRGTIDGATVPTREVVKEALYHNAAAMIVAHNHPSGIAEPSLADKNMTIRLKQALDMVGVKLLDHFVIGDGESVSLAERGVC